MQYCFVLTKQEQYETVDVILRHIMVSNAYQARERQDSIRLALISEHFVKFSSYPALMWSTFYSLCYRLKSPRHCGRSSQKVDNLTSVQ